LADAEREYEGEINWFLVPASPEVAPFIGNSVSKAEAFVVPFDPPFTFCVKPALVAAI
jgi:hypothetical protein